jgi:hypothetical protein
MIVNFSTLVDITNTNITRNFRAQGSPLSQKEWDFLRNEQRNWEVVIQLLGLRFQPVNIIGPQKYIKEIQDLNFGNYFSNQNEVSIWEFSCEYDNISLDLLKEDFTDIPIISNLNESVIFDKSCFITNGEKTNLMIIC